MMIALIGVICTAINEALLLCTNCEVCDFCRFSGQNRKNIYKIKA